MIQYIEDAGRRAEVVRSVLEALPEWFEVEEGRERYIAASREQVCLAAIEDGRAVGFVCLKVTGAATAELAVMGVLRDFHRRGLGRALVEAAKGAGV